MKIILKIKKLDRLEAAASNTKDQIHSKDSGTEKIKQFTLNMVKELGAAFKENVGNTQYCSIIFSAVKDGSSEDLKINYEYIPSKSGPAEKFFKGVANIRTGALKELTFIKSHELIKIKFADDLTYEYGVTGGNIKKLFDLD